MVRAKFRCHSVEPNSYGGKTAKLHPVYAGSEENDKFFQSTPGGEISLYMVKGEAAEAFEAGKFYYVDFTPAN